MEKLIAMKDALVCCAECQMEHLEDTDAEELGEVIDMIKDLEEAIYYHTIVESMKEPHSYGFKKHYEKTEEHHTQDSKEGKSPHFRKAYIESRENHQDKTIQMRELERYMQELTQDVVEMVNDASPEEKQYLSKKVAALASKLSQLNS
jgi:hypothetical protein